MRAPSRPWRRNENRSRACLRGAPCLVGCGTDARGGGALRRPGGSRPAECHHHLGGDRGGGSVHVAGRRERGALARTPVVLPRRGDIEAVARFGNQDRGLAAVSGVEPQVPGGRQRRVQRRDRARRDGGGAWPRLRRRLHRYGSRGGQREVRLRSPGKGDRLRLARGARDDGGCEEDRRGPLWRRRDVLVLERMLRGRPPGDEGSAAFPRGLRRHHRRCAGPRLDRARGAGRSGGAAADGTSGRAVVADGTGAVTRRGDRRM